MNTFWDYKRVATYGAIVGAAYNALMLLIHGVLFTLIGHSIGNILYGAIACAVLFLIVAAIRNQVVTGSWKPGIATVVTRDINDTTTTL